MKRPVININIKGRHTYKYIAATGSPSVTDFEDIFTQMLFIYSSVIILLKYTQLLILVV